MSARDALIASVTGLVRRRGVAGTGLKALLEDSGVARRSVYLNFPGGTPKELVEAIEKTSRKPLNAIIPDELAKMRLPALKMNGVTAPQLFDALSAATAKTETYSYQVGFNLPP